MAQQSNDNRVSKPIVASKSQATYNYTKIQSLLDARIIHNGAVTGTRYEWPSAGSIVNVDPLDVPELLSYRLGHETCCGGADPKGNVVFQQVN